MFRHVLHFSPKVSATIESNELESRPPMLTASLVIVQNQSMQQEGQQPALNEPLLSQSKQEEFSKCVPIASFPRCSPGHCLIRHGPMSQSNNRQHLPSVLTSAHLRILSDLVSKALKEIWLAQILVVAFAITASVVAFVFLLATSTSFDFTKQGTVSA